MLCPTCGASLEPDSTQCSVCGQNCKGSLEQSQNKQSGFPSWLKLFIVLVILVAATLLYLMLNKPNEVESPVTPFPTSSLSADLETSANVLALVEMTDQTAQKNSLKADDEHTQIFAAIQEHLASLKRGDIENAYRTLASKEFSESTALDKYREFVKSYPELTEYTALEPGKIETEGNFRLATVALQSDKGESQVEFRLVKEGNQWKIWGITITMSANYPIVTTPERQELLTTLNDFFNSLKENDVSKAYYGLAALNFKKVSNFETFQDFLKTHPMLSQFDKVHFGEAFTEGELRLVRLAISNKQSVTEVDVRLIKEGNQWKIWGISIYPPKELAGVHKNKQEDLVALIEGQLTALKANDISKAYYAFTAPEFQQAASRESYKKFVEGQDVLSKNNSFVLHKVQFEKNSAVANVDLTSVTGEVKNIDYRFAYDNGEWKILSLQILATVAPAESKEAEQTPQGALEFTKAVMGTKVDSQGLVMNETTTFQPDKEVMVNLYIHNGVVGTVIEALLEHGDTSTLVAPTKVGIEKNGDSILTFIFKPPTQGWAIGNYRVHITSSTGEKKEFPFVVLK